MYIVENNPLLRPILHEAANSCLNPNVWFYQRKWSPGMLTNYKYHKRFFKPGHQPNRRWGSFCMLGVELSMTA